MGYKLSIAGGFDLGRVRCELISDELQQNQCNSRKGQQIKGSDPREPVYEFIHRYLSNPTKSYQEGDTSNPLRSPVMTMSLLGSLLRKVSQFKMIKS